MAKFTKEDQAELDRLMVEFDAAGGRGVELADRIDELTRRRDWDYRFDSLSDDERCQVCGQPDNCGDCDHTPLPADQAAFLLDMEGYRNMKDYLTARQNLSKQMAEAFIEHMNDPKVD